MPRAALKRNEVFSDNRNPGALVPELLWSERRDQLHEQLRQKPLAGISAEEIEVHFSAMPAHYWERVTENDLAWGLEAVHEFFNLVSSPSIPATMLAVQWRQLPGVPTSQIMLCTWDRQGLLAKAAAAFSAVRLSILQADVFTRVDNVVLDVFSVVDFHSHGPASPTRLEEMKFLLDGALGEPPRFASIWACTQHKYLAPPTHTAPRIVFDNDSSPANTLVHVVASDRLGLLYDILQTMADKNLNITQARIETRDAIAHDVFQITEAHGQKILDAERLAALRRDLLAAVNVEI